MLSIDWKAGHPIPDNETRERLNTMRKESVMTDMKLGTGEKSFPCHKVILTNASSKIDQVVQLNAMMNPGKVPMIIVDEAHLNSIESLLNCVYLGCSPVKSRTLDGIRKLAEELCIDLKLEGCGLLTKQAQIGKNKNRGLILTKKTTSNTAIQDPLKPCVNPRKKDAGTEKPNLPVVKGKSGEAFDDKSTHPTALPKAKRPADAISRSKQIPLSVNQVSKCTEAVANGKSGGDGKSSHPTALPKVKGPEDSISKSKQPSLPQYQLNKSSEAVALEDKKQTSLPENQAKKKPSPKVVPTKSSSEPTTIKPRVTAAQAVKIFKDTVQPDDDFRPSMFEPEKVTEKQASSTEKNKQKKPSKGNNPKTRGSKKGAARKLAKVSNTKETVRENVNLNSTYIVQGPSNEENEQANKEAELNKESSFSKATVSVPRRKKKVPSSAIEVNTGEKAGIKNLGNPERISDENSTKIPLQAVQSELSRSSDLRPRRAAFLRATQRFRQS